MTFIGGRHLRHTHNPPRTPTRAQRQPQPLYWPRWLGSYGSLLARTTPHQARHDFDRRAHLRSADIRRGICTVRYVSTAWFGRDRDSAAQNPLPDGGSIIDAIVVSDNKAVERLTAGACDFKPHSAAVRIRGRSSESRGSKSHFA